MLSLEGFIHNSSLISLLVLLWLSIYFIVTFWIFFYKFFLLKTAFNKEKDSLDAILTGKAMTPSDSLFQKITKKPSKELLLVWRSQVQKRISTGLVVLSIISSTAPFIGLFGTVVEILDAFGRLGSGGQVAFDVIAPVISQALIATAAGILVAIPAYSFFLMLKRKAYDISVFVQMQIDILSTEKRTAIDKGVNIGQ
ncbi:MULTISPECIES: MotA/TolQ/ExbB proton channel family protein [unclassified Helicobacter]|uniref:MotA/TolQ/ExbB proton channel family protein n=1 Tax=unclassified Helicobacter TaxID=2593540 RepID=UPI000CF1A0C3|nr:MULTISPECIES: MotA/TolQ/ExbB proton channel family protein [unclassified Helicobacter]